MSENVVAVRSIEIVTAEIHTIRDNVAKVFMDGVVQIGRRLEEAKQLVPQGEWLRYLDEELGYKPSTAQNYMRIAREFGDGQVGLSGKTASDFFGQLGYSQLLPLLGLPEEEREQLAEEHDLAGMSSREIAALVKERDEAKAAAEAAQSEWQQMLSRLDESDKKKVEYLRKLHEARNQAKAGKEAAREAEEKAAAIQQRLDELEQQDGQPRELTDEELEKIRADVAAEQAAAVQAAEERAAEAMAKLEKVKNPAAHKVNFLFGELGEVWQRLEAALDELAGTDAAAAARMRGAIVGAVREWLAL